MINIPPQISSFSRSSFWDTKPKDRLQLLMQRPLQTRVAPSPTGFMHVGTLRTAWQNFLLAKCSGGKFVLRIDDTDDQRNNPDSVQQIFDMIKQYNLSPDVCFRQSDRFLHYLKIASTLVDAGICDLDDGAVVLPLKTNTAIDFFDLGAGVQRIPILGDRIVLLRQNKKPTYHFASVIDDIDYNINTVLRGADHLMNTPKHILIAQKLQQCHYPKADQFLNNVVFGHVGLITQKGKKLSKRDLNSNLQQYDNINPQAVLHWCLMLGWGHPQSDFDKTHPIFDDFDFLKQGGFRHQNMDINLTKLAFLDKKYRSRNINWSF